MFELDEKAFKEWFKNTANENANFTSMRLQAWEEIEELESAGERPQYELDGQYTKSGNPEIYRQ